MDTATLTLRVHADVRWALPNEFGTIHMPARPFLRPALAEASGFWGSVISTEMEFHAVGAGTFDVPETRGVNTVVKESAMQGESVPASGKRGPRGGWG
jgi:hypothetical protein